MARKYTDHIVDPHPRVVIPVLDSGSGTDTPFEEISNDNPLSVKQKDGVVERTEDLTNILLTEIRDQLLLITLILNRLIGEELTLDDLGDC